MFSEFCKLCSCVSVEDLLKSFFWVTMLHEYINAVSKCMLSAGGLLFTCFIEALRSICYQDSLDAWEPGLGEKRKE